MAEKSSVMCVCVFDFAEGKLSYRITDTAENVPSMLIASSVVKKFKGVYIQVSC
jgi:hypothetical protein